MAKSGGYSYKRFADSIRDSETRRKYASYLRQFLFEVPDNVYESATSKIFIRNTGETVGGMDLETCIKAKSDSATLAIALNNADKATVKGLATLQIDIDACAVRISRATESPRRQTMP